MDASRPRDVIVDSLGSLDDPEAERLRSGDPSLARAHLQALNDNRTWVRVLGVTMAVMAIVLPTAGLYQFFRAVNNLEPIELIGVIAAACLVAAVQMAVAAYVYTDWQRRRLCYRVLHALGPESSGPGPAATGSLGDDQSGPDASHTEAADTEAADTKGPRSTSSNRETTAS
jgi:hypothetical protein